MAVRQKQQHERPRHVHVQGMDGVDTVVPGRELSFDVEAQTAGEHDKRDLPLRKKIQEFAEACAQRLGGDVFKDVAF